MKKIFTLFSILFALLAGFNACGNTKDTDTGNTGNIGDTGNTGDSVPDDSGTTQDDNNSDGVGDTGYGVGYVVFIKASGIIVNNDLKPLKNININMCDKKNDCNFATASNDQGKFEFTERYGTGDSFPKDVTLKIYDLNSEYSSLETEIQVNCERDSYDYLCESENLTITLEKAPVNDNDTVNDQDYDTSDIDSNDINDIEPDSSDSDNTVLNDDD